eukprot:CAMPEP_0194528440 /NCGR_PEP_ID=MMETSP0253-20130528/64848_1 /TAXON_ID=2966 /ORGANISM="Noctiluca scintillans" /LENGTH=149 /DNA_ID=CAMNT_0039373487 /DNA_START=402 /DNA_END=852 /DNA_ORIENTATION=-
MWCLAVISTAIENLTGNCGASNNDPVGPRCVENNSSKSSLSEETCRKSSECVRSKHGPSSKLGTDLGGSGAIAVSSGPSSNDCGGSARGEPLASNLCIWICSGSRDWSMSSSYSNLVLEATTSLLEETCVCHASATTSTSRVMCVWLAV